jgi:hypothetical protein
MRVEPGDLVECVAVADLGMCVCVRILPADKVGAHGGRRSVVNAVLKTMKKKTGASKTGVTMAKGPDNTLGFTPGWRLWPSIQGLPWATLIAQPQDEGIPAAVVEESEGEHKTV